MTSHLHTLTAQFRRVWRNDDGAGFAIPLFVVLLAITAAASLSLLVDGGRATTAQRNANSIAFQASRSAAQELDTSELLRSGTIVVSPAADTAAHQTAATLLDRVGLSGSVTSVDVDGRHITVTITATESLTGSAVLGRSTVTVQGTGSTRIAAGVVSEETPLP